MSKSILPVSALQTPVVEARTGSATGQWLKWFSNVQQFLENLSFSDVGGTLDAGQLPANVPVVSFGTVLPGPAKEGDIFFITIVSPYHGFVFQAGVWQQFS